MFEWTDPHAYNSLHPELEARRREHEARRNASPLARSRYNDVDSRSGSPSSYNSLCTSPPSPSLRTDLYMYTGGRPTSPQAIPHLSPSNSSNAVSTASADTSESPASQSLDRSVQAGQRWYSTVVSPKTPPPNPPSVILPYHQRPSGLTHPLPGSFYKAVEEAVQDPPAPSDTGHRRSDTSVEVASTPASMFQRMRKSASKQEMLTETPNEEKPIRKIVALMKARAVSGNEHKEEVSHQGVMGKLEVAFAYSKVQKVEVSGVPLKKKKKGYCEHRTYTCVAGQCARRNSVIQPPLTSEKNPANKTPSSLNFEAWDPVTRQGSTAIPQTGKTARKEPDTIPRKSSTDPNRFVDFAERQRAMRALFLQRERAQRVEWQAKLAKQREECKILEKTRIRAQKPPHRPTESSQTAPMGVGKTASTVANSGSPSGIVNGVSSLAKNAAKAESSPTATAHVPVFVQQQEEEEEEVNWNDIHLTDDEEWEKVVDDEGDEWEVIEK